MNFRQSNHKDDGDSENNDDEVPMWEFRDGEIYWQNIKNKKKQSSKNIELSKIGSYFDDDKRNSTHDQDSDSVLESSQTGNILNTTMACNRGGNSGKVKHPIITEGTVSVVTSHHTLLVDAMKPTTSADDDD